MKEKKERDTKIAELISRLDNSERAKKKLLAERAQGAESFEIPDGVISWVNQNGTVWINLGSADALRPQVTFSIYDAALRDPAKAEKKGSSRSEVMRGTPYPNGSKYADNLSLVEKEPCLSANKVTA